MKSIRENYVECGVDEYYKNNADAYENPHFSKIEHLLSEYLTTHDIGTKILDLCCGSGEVTRILERNGNYAIIGADPYMNHVYEERTGRKCLPYSFQDIVQEAAIGAYDTIICSFAMHLCEISMLNTLLYQLSCKTNKLIILSPHKRPEINCWFKMVDSYEFERVKMKVYEKI